ncbi:elongation factor Ts [Chitinophaga ginsengisegetis]|uniref:Elongation factor Ts n=1 Tax=Chitinophaga ginsengisegetis TaxID=393003 RepID=A0A1T5P6X5_9BACT|nr:translation elongation factor Ts [Chitinophaga ginsengisegetis]MDR6566346.1 elongation factor Ts [Chitinophaga ginsengisegetis]MDR6646076.1 elongation factor Ts [Chitinophaga ginsengisegetis]MDR6651332.1 elongation factor Ts [Chitinophaga ginsengisegetis]SKD08118.1 elongation factor Ts [Chitinophaga ginsengisegetis]
MATITAADVNKLRQQTGAGMMDCRKALVESDGDFEKAVDYLRKKGQKVAALRSDRETKEGVIIAKTAADGKSGVIVGLGCETDFVAKNEDFVKFAQSIVDLALASGIKTVEDLNAAQLDGASVADKVNDQVAKIGEKITLNKFEFVEAGGVTSYIHGNYRMGVLVAFSKPVSEEVGKDIAMQIAAMSPIAVDADSVPAELIAREKEIAVEQVKAEGKPAEMAEKIAAGKVNKFFKESTLLQQAFVKDNNKSVADYLKSVDADLKVTSFKRVALG